MTDTPADTAGRPSSRRKPRGPEEPILETRRDVLTPDLRGEAEAQGRDPEEVDPLAEDEETFRRADLGGSTALD